jgi:drug/metabolite transporter (DMT)-like permease
MSSGRVVPGHPRYGRDDGTIRFRGHSFPRCGSGALRVISFDYLVTCASILAFTSYTWLIHHEPATRVASYAYVNPLIALIVGVTLGGEHISALQAAGAALIILGVVATMLSKLNAQVARPPVTESAASR